MNLRSCRPSNSPVGTIARLGTCTRATVLPAFQFPSWYNQESERRTGSGVLPAFQFPSWYNRERENYERLHVLPAFQFPSWYN